MSKVRANQYVDRTGTGAIDTPYGVNTAGIVTASYFYGDGANLTNVGMDTSDVVSVATTTTKLNVVGDAQVGGALTITGNLTVDGTETIVNTETLNVADKTVGIGSTVNPTNSTADGAGIEIYASHDTSNNNKSLKWENGSNCFVRSVPDRFLGVSETVAAATTYVDGSNVVLEMDLQAATVYTYTMPSVWSSGAGSNIGIVSFKNMYADAQNGQTVTLITTQGAAHGGGTGYANTVSSNGIGATCRIIPLKDNSAVAGILTAGRVGGTGLLAQPAGLTTVTLSPAKGAVDFISFFVHYNGGTNTDLNSYKVYVSKNGGFGFGSVGI